MDFISIAEATAPHAIRRFLQQQQVISEDDDFSHLDTSHTSHHDQYASTYHTTSTQQQQNDSIMNAANIVSSNTMGDNPDLVNTPFFGPAAEAELFMLATNFLLCEFPFLSVFALSEMN